MQLGSECHPGSMGFVYVEFWIIDNARAGRINIALKMPFRRYILEAREKMGRGNGSHGALREVGKDHENHCPLLRHIYSVTYIC
jgi:hypothetical protein